MIAWYCYPIILMLLTALGACFIQLPGDRL